MPAPKQPVILKDHNPRSRLRHDRFDFFRLGAACFSSQPSRKSTLQTDAEWRFPSQLCWPRPSDAPRKPLPNPHRHPHRPQGRRQQPTRCEPNYHPLAINLTSVAKPAANATPRSPNNMTIILWVNRCPECPIWLSSNRNPLIGSTSQARTNIV